MPSAFVHSRLDSEGATLGTRVGSSTQDAVGGATDDLTAAERPFPGVATQDGVTEPGEGIEGCVREAAF